MVRLDRYMLSQFLFLFGFFSLVLVGVFWINRGVSLFDQLISNGQSALVFLEFTVLGLPHLITIVLPIAAFAATAYVTNRLSSESELTVMQATGYGPFRLAWPVLLFGLFVLLMSSALLHFLKPMAQEQLTERQNEVAQNATARLLTEGRFLHPTDGVTFYAGEIDQDGVLRDVFLSDERRSDQGVIYTAAQAYLIRLEDRTTLIMVDGMAQRLDETDDRLATANFRDFSFDISALVSSDSEKKTDIRAMTTPELMQPWDELSEVSGRSIGYITQNFHERFSEPMFCVVAAMIGFSVLLVGGYSRFGVWREIGLAFAALIALDGFNSALQPMVEQNASRWPILYLPTVVSLLLVLILLRIAARPRGSFLRLFRRTA